MDTVTVVVSGTPVAKGRARIGKLFNGRPVAFTPSKTRSYEGMVKRAAELAMKGRTPFAGPVAAVLTAFRPLPKSFSRKRREAALRDDLLPVTKPDADNYAKAALDALNTIVYRDDSQVTDLVVRKRYSEKPRLEIEVTALRVAA